MHREQRTAFRQRISADAGREEAQQVSSPSPVPPKKRVLFICSGNYYRSRLAEILFNHAAAAAGLAWEAGSRCLLKARELKGMSGHTTAYLKAA